MNACETGRAATSDVARVRRNLTDAREKGVTPTRLAYDRVEARIYGPA